MRWSVGPFAAALVVFWPDAFRLLGVEEVGDLSLPLSLETFPPPFFSLPVVRLLLGENSFVFTYLRCQAGPVSMEMVSGSVNEKSDLSEIPFLPSFVVFPLPLCSSAMSFFPSPILFFIPSSSGRGS